MDPFDSGPIYKETLMGRLPVEPWNTASNLFFLALVLFWTYRVYKNYQQHRFIGFMLPVLFIGWIGGTVYHATRSHEAWLLMDWVPILLLSVAVSIYYSIKQRIPRKKTITLSILPIILAFGLRHLAINDIMSRNIGSLISYSMMAFIILFPIFRYLSKTKWHNAKWVIAAMSSFILAISFRSIDLLVDLDFLPMGTHWLWHSFGALSATLLITFIYYDDLKYPGRIRT